MLEEFLDDIPRWYTAVAEWTACLVYVLLLRRRLRPAALVVVLAAALAALLGIQTVAGAQPIELWTPGMLVAFGAMYSLILACSEVRPRAAVYFAARAFVLAELVASFQWQLRSYVVSANGVISAGVDLVLLAVLYGGLFLVAYFLERRHFPHDSVQTVTLKHAVSAMAIAAVTFFMSNLSFVSSSTPFSSRLGLEVFYIRTLVDLAGYVALYAQQGQRMELQRAVEVQAMDSLLRSQHVQYLQTQRNIDVVNAKYHDLKHYIAAIRGEEDPGRTAGYLDQLEESIRDYDNKVDSGHPVLDAVLTSRAQTCATHGITLTCVADGAAVAFIDAVALSALVGNALDNAIEAALAIDDLDRRLIRVAIYRQDSFAMLRFENYYEADLTFADGLPLTTKYDTAHHGYGLRNMRQIAESYAGSLTVQADDGWYVVRVLVPIAPRDDLDRAR